MTQSRKAPDHPPMPAMTAPHPVSKKESNSYWYLIHTKPRQEQRALINLEQQGYECYLPMLAVEKLRKGTLTVADEPLFPRYLFIRLDFDEAGRGWWPIRSTKGVSRLVTFGAEPAKVDAHLIENLRSREEQALKQPQKLFTPGERLLVTDGVFAGIEAIYQMSDGESRVLALIELMGKATLLKVAPTSLRKISGS